MVVSSNDLRIAADQPQAGGQACLPERADDWIRWL